MDSLFSAYVLNVVKKSLRERLEKKDGIFHQGGGFPTQFPSFYFFKGKNKGARGKVKKKQVFSIF